MRLISIFVFLVLMPVCAFAKEYTPPKAETCEIAFLAIYEAEKSISPLSYFLIGYVDSQEKLTSFGNRLKTDQIEILAQFESALVVLADLCRESLSKMPIRPPTPQSLLTVENCKEQLQHEQPSLVTPILHLKALSDEIRPSQIDALWELALQVKNNIEFAIKKYSSSFETAFRICNK